MRSPILAEALEHCQRSLRPEDGPDRKKSKTVIHRLSFAPFFVSEDFPPTARR
jgi:hypothetical protein